MAPRCQDNNNQPPQDSKQIAITNKLERQTQAVTNSNNAPHQPIDIGPYGLLAKPKLGVVVIGFGHRKQNHHALGLQPFAGFFDQAHANALMLEGLIHRQISEVGDIGEIGRGARNTDQLVSEPGPPPTSCSTLNHDRDRDHVGHARGHGHDVLCHGRMHCHGRGLVCHVGQNVGLAHVRAPNVP